MTETMFRYMPDFIDNQKVTITDIVEKSLKKGKGSEIKAAARLSLLLAVQLPEPEEVRNIRIFSAVYMTRQLNVLIYMIFIDLVTLIYICLRFTTNCRGLWPSMYPTQHNHLYPGRQVISA